MPDGPKDQGTARPAVKRIRSDNDHSKGDTKAREAKRRGGEGTSGGEDKDEGDDNGKAEGEGEGEGEGEERGDDHQDEDWLQQPPFQVGYDESKWKTVWRQSCWCGKVAFAYSADPLQAKFCHCEDCQRLHGAPFQHAAVFEKDKVRLDADPEWLGFLSAHGEVHPLSDTPTPIPRKISCRACGSPLMDEGRNMIMAFPPTFEWPRSNDEVEGKGEAEGGDGDGDEGKRTTANPTSEELERQEKEKEGSGEEDAHADADGDGDEENEKQDENDDNTTPTTRSQSKSTPNGKSQKSGKSGEANKSGGTKSSKSSKSSNPSKSSNAGGTGHKHPTTLAWKHAGLPPVFQAKCHIFYERRVVDVRDGLVKWRGHKEKSEKMGDDER